MSEEQGIPYLDEKMTEIFGPKGKHGVEEEIRFEVPKEIESLYERYGLEKNRFDVTLRRLKDENDSFTRGKYVESWTNIFPPVDWIGTVYGPGSYVLQFKFKVKDPDDNNRRRWFNEEIPVNIDDSFEDRHEMYQLRRMIENKSKIRKILEKEEIKKKLATDISGNDTGGNEGGNDHDKMIDALKKLRRDAVELGMTPSEGVQKSGIDIYKLLTGIAPLVAPVIGMLRESAEARRAENQKFMTLLLSTMSNNNNQMLELAKSNSGNGSGTKMLEDFKEMIMGTIDIKEMVNGKKESAVDRIFGMVEKAMPVIVELAQAGKAQRENDFRYKAAAGMIEQNPDFQKIINNEEERKAAVLRWDEYFGFEQCDMILEVAGISRPEECPRQESQRKPKGMREESTDGQENAPQGTEEGEHKSAD